LSQSNRPGGSGRRPIPRRDPAEIEARVKNRDRSEIEQHLRSQDRSAIDAHLRSRDRTYSATRDKTISEAQARSRARASGADVRTGGYQPRERRRNMRRLAIILATLVTALLLLTVLVPPLAGGLFRSLAEANPDLMRVGAIADAVGAVMDDRPDIPGGTDPTEVEFVIEPGQSSGQITDNLVERGLITDRLAFTYVLASEDGLGNLKAGSHVLSRTMTPREVADVLQGTPSAIVSGVPVALREGLRLEQIVAYLQTLPLDKLDIEKFYELATDPPDLLRQEFPWLGVIPEGRSVEGFLGSGLFQVPPDVDAQTMLETLLQRWQDGPSYEVYRQAQAEGKDFYSTVILASIVEREAILDEEKPLIAGVYQNRVDGVGGPGERTLNSEPVLIYAKDSINLRDLHITQWPDYVFWTLDGLGPAASFEVPPDLEGFQVWHSRGLPPGPIATPGLASLQAALAPDTADGYLYFLAKGDGSNGHVFARTYEEHLRNIETYLGGASPAPSPTIDGSSDSIDLSEQEAK